MTAGKHDFTIEKGTTFTRVLTWKDENSSAYDLTGYTARMHVRETVNESDTIVELTTENSRISLGGVAGTITLTITAADTAALTEDSGVYDLELVSSGGEVTRLLEGNVSIPDEVTR